MIEYNENLKSLLVSAIKKTKKELDGKYGADKLFGYALCTDEGKRTISFTKAGNYEVKAHSALWCPPGVSAKPITIEVTK